MRRTPSLTRIGVVATTANPPPNTPNPTQNPGSNDDQEARDAGIDPESYEYGKQAVSALPSMTPEETDWIDRFLTELEARGFFDDAKSRDIRAIFD